jgi:Bacterial protein of unknown function (DUF937)
MNSISGAAPAILSGLAGVASKPEGARQLSAAIAGLPSNLLDDLAGMIGGSGRLANIGNAALTKLFGSTARGCNSRLANGLRDSLL